MHLTKGERALMPKAGMLQDLKVQTIVQRFTNRRRCLWARAGYPTDLRKLRALARVL